MRYELKHNDITHELLDGEIVIVDLSQGTYYNLTGISAVVWQYLTANCALDDIVTTLATHYSQPLELINQSVTQFAQDLEKEELIIPSTQKNSVSKNKEVPLPDCFEPPIIQKYTDIQDLLLLDPIHEVDASGWPNIPEFTND